MNAWDELNRDDPSGKRGDQPADRDEAAVGAEADQVDDARTSRYDEHIIEAEETEKPKKNLKPLLFAMGGLMLLIVGGMVYVVLALLGAPVQPAGYNQAPAQIEQPAALSLQAPPADQVSMFADAPSSAPTAPAATAVDQSPVTRELIPAPAHAPAQTVGTDVAAVSAGVATPASAQLPGGNAEQQAALESRLVVMEGDIAEIKRKLDELARAARVTQAAAKPHARPVRASAATSKPRQPQGSAATPSKEATSSTGVTTNSAPVVAPSNTTAGVEGLSLRAVNPPHGPDMQAWVMDGDRIMVLSRGSTIRGARVTSIELDRVVTDRGVIR